MKIGDKVRFLYEVGGGTVSGFQGKDIVMVEDEDGFQIPMMRTELVAVNDRENAAMGAVPEEEEKKPPVPTPALAEEPKPTFRVKPLERKGGNVLNLYLSFLPVEVKEISTTNFEAYFVNDSNYYLQVLYLSAENASWKVRFCSLIEPNSKIFVEEFDRSQLNEMERVCVQVLAWKEDKPFALKPALSTELRIDGTKFYKLHCFRPNEFFRDPNLTLPVVQNDEPAR